VPAGPGRLNTRRGIRRTRRSAAAPRDQRINVAVVLSDQRISVAVALSDQRISIAVALRLRSKKNKKIP